MEKVFVHSQCKSGVLSGFLFMGLIFCLTFSAVLTSQAWCVPLSGNGNLVLTEGGAINNQGTLVILGNITNNGSANLGTGSVKFSGTTVQSVNGTNIFQNLEVDNGSGVSLGGSATVNGTLTLTNGILTLGDHNLILGSSAGIAGTPDAGKMIVATGSGELRKQFSGTGNFTYPVGDNTGTAEYSPVELTFTTGTFGSGCWAGVNLVNEPYPESSGSYLNRYWNVTSGGISGFTCDAQFNYLYPSDVVGIENELYCLQVSPNPILVYENTNTLLHQLSASGLESFGTFTGWPGARDLNIAAIMIEGLYDGGGMMHKAMDEFGDHFGGDTADVINIELHKASDYSSIKYSANNILLNTSGTASVKVPPAFNEWYYVTVKHRNSIETTTADSVHFSPFSISYSFNLQEKAYGNNLGVMIDGTAVIFSGDTNQDGLVDGSDLSEMGNLSDVGALGYLAEDLTGDGLVDGSDLSIAGNNSDIGVTAITP